MCRSKSAVFKFLSCYIVLWVTDRDAKETWGRRTAAAATAADDTQGDHGWQWRRRQISANASVYVWWGLYATPAHSECCFFAPCTNILTYLHPSLIPISDAVVNFSQCYIMLWYTSASPWEATPYLSSSTSFRHQFLYFRLTYSFIYHFFLFWFTTLFIYNSLSLSLPA